MLSIVFINPPVHNFRKITRNFDCASESKGNYLLQPFDFVSLSAGIPHACKLHFIDAIADQITADTILKDLIVKHADIVIIAMAYTSWEEDFSFLQKISEYTTASILVFGDIFVEQEYVELVTPFIKGVINSPVEFRIDVLSTDHRYEIQGLKGCAQVIAFGDKKTPIVISNGIPRHDLFNHSRYRWPFATYKRYTSVSLTWGCPYRCKYCIDSLFPFIYRTVEEVESELDYIYSLGIQEIYFSDKSFGFLKYYTKKILELMLEKKYNFSWSTYFHPNQFSEELLLLMKRAGCHTIIIGVEDINDDRLARYSRNTRRTELKKYLKLCKKLHLNVCADYLFGLKEQSEEDIYRIINYALELDTDYASFNIAAPLPGSIVKQEAIRDGRLGYQEYGYDSVGSQKALPSAQISAERLIYLRNYAVYKFYLRPKYILRRIFMIRGWEHFIIQFQEMLELFSKAR